ncbi:MAG: hypothetical protein KAH48_04230 [Chlorobi bacterium]|nr:hypothetical protein [Chlorobiota bacterium]
MIYSLKNEHNAVFEKLLDNSVDFLQNKAVREAQYFKSRLGIKLEKDVYEVMCALAVNSEFENNIELISGQRFPDIVSFINEQHGFGVEVKTSSQNHWKTTGSSIFEGTRIDNIDRIYLLYGKLADPIEFKYRRYEECLYNVAITHSPRYLIDMETKAGDSIFDKIGVDYESLRNLKNPFAPVRNYIKQNKCKPGEEVWWLESDNQESSDIVKLWKNLTLIEQKNLRIRAMVLFPQIFGEDQNKYSNVATWLVAEHHVVHPSLRDTFSAGGKQELIVGSETIIVPRMIKYLAENYADIMEMLRVTDHDKLKYHWKIDKFIRNEVSTWKELVNKYYGSKIIDLLDEQ